MTGMRKLPAGRWGGCFRRRPGRGAEVAAAAPSAEAEVAPAMRETLGPAGEGLPARGRREAALPPGLLRWVRAGVGRLVRPSHSPPRLRAPAPLPGRGGSPRQTEEPREAGAGSGPLRAGPIGGSGLRSSARGAGAWPGLAAASVAPPEQGRSGASAAAAGAACRGRSGRPISSEALRTEK